MIEIHLKVIGKRNEEMSYKLIPLLQEIFKIYLIPSKKKDTIEWKGYIGMKGGD